jgi:hypothetical protein
MRFNLKPGSMLQRTRTDDEQSNCFQKVDYEENGPARC